MLCFQAFLLLIIASQLLATADASYSAANTAAASLLSPMHQTNTHTSNHKKKPKYQITAAK